MAAKRHGAATAAKRALTYDQGRGYALAPQTPLAKNRRDRHVPALLKQKLSERAVTPIDYDQSLSMAMRLLPGGREAFIRIVQLAAEGGDDDAKKFRSIWFDLSAWDQAHANVDLVCLAAGIDRGTLVGTMARTAFNFGCDVGNLIASVAHPTIIEGTVRSAKRLNSAIGQRDRMALLAHSGFLPTPKGATINVVASANAAAAASAAASPSMPSFLEDINAASSARDSALAGSPTLARSPDEDAIDV